MFLGTFRLKYECRIEYEYNFWISNQLGSHSCDSLLMLLTSREEGSRNEIGLIHDNL